MDVERSANARALSSVRGLRLALLASRVPMAAVLYDDRVGAEAAENIGDGAVQPGDDGADTDTAPVPIMTPSTVRNERSLWAATRIQGQPDSGK